MIQVQPLKRSEMQVNLNRQTAPTIHIFIESFVIAFLCSGSWNWWSYPWNLWVPFTRIRRHCRVLWVHPLLPVSQPIPQCSTRFELVSDGSWAWRLNNVFPTSGSVGLVSRFGQFYKSVDPGLVQVNVCTESLRIVDVKIQISPIGRQTVMYVAFSPYSKIFSSLISTSIVKYPW